LDYANGELSVKDLIFHLSKLFNILQKERLYSSKEKMVAKSNCPIFDDWGDYSEQAVSTQNQARTTLLSHF